MQPEVPAPELSPASSRALVSSQVLARLCKNPEPHPGVFSFGIDVIMGDMKQGFWGETYMHWKDFTSHVLAYLDAPEEVQLVYKFVGDNSKASRLSDAEAFHITMEQICHKASNARTHFRAINEDSMQLKAYKQLECQIRCELHHSHCFIDHTSGYDNHCHLNHAEITLWAKKILSSTNALLEKNKKNKTWIPNITLLDYPKIEVLLVLIDAKKLELQISELETPLLDAGTVSSNQVILLLEDILSVISTMGQKQARILCNYAK
ncbi:hypothetical protein BDR07DRAFT_1280910 [Suillus spraguei]|nr:hypothetical protein BDR07DRAFT_1280910 [Suillus spraguei]